MPVEDTPSPAPLTPEILLQRAARCYADAGWMEDASRLLDEMGDLNQAALHYEEQEMWEQAADRYWRAAQWRSAARCYLQVNRWGAAADCWLEEGNVLREIPHTDAIQEWTTRAAAIAEILDRPDLSATAHALAATLGLSQARSRWEQWAIARLGDATGVPAPENDGETTDRPEVENN